LGFAIDADTLRIPVVDPADNTLFQDATSPVVQAMDSQFLAPVRWCDVLQHIATRYEARLIIDMGPGDGVAKLSGSALRGRGFEVVAAATTAGRRRLFTRGERRNETRLDYQSFAPRKVRL